MRSIKFNLSKIPHSSWDAAVELCAIYLDRPQKANELLDQLPKSFPSNARSSCQYLFLGALRHGHRTRSVLKQHLRKRPHPRTEAVLLVAGFELFDSPTEKAPQIIHHAVERSKRLLRPSENGLINALLRKLSLAYQADIKDNSLFEQHSHPKWLVESWLASFGEADCRKLLKWNQRTPQTYIKSSAKLPKGFQSTQWPQFYTTPTRKDTAEHSVLSGSDLNWLEQIRPLLESADAYIKDPSTRLASELLAPKSGDTVLDLCAAPGGKAFDLSKIMLGKGLIVAVDLPGKRTESLEENLAKIRSHLLSCERIDSDVLALNEESFTKCKLPTKYDAVMLDVPCSNTGVIQRRTDVKWRLRESDVSACAKLQLQLLHSASRFVQPGGRLVYSTCSIETEENRAVVDAFLESKSGSSFILSDTAISYPWETGHDGAGAFLLLRNG